MWTKRVRAGSYMRDLSGRRDRLLWLSTHITGWALHRQASGAPKVDCTRMRSVWTKRVRVGSYARDLSGCHDRLLWLSTHPAGWALHRQASGEPQVDCTRMRSVWTKRVRAGSYTRDLSGCHDQLSWLSTHVAGWRHTDRRPEKAK